jgi:hypothetical protein
VNDIIRLRAAAGSGIKNPSQTELFGFNATGPFPFRGNPNLKPEKSHGWEAGTDLSFWDGRISLGATYFHARLKNEIFGFFGGTAPPGCPVPPAGTSTTCNRAFDSIQKGVELFGDLRLLGRPHGLRQLHRPEREGERAGGDPARAAHRGRQRHLDAPGRPGAGEPERALQRRPAGLQLHRHRRALPARPAAREAGDRANAARWCCRPSPW